MKIQYDLIQNGMDSLKHALSHYEEGQNNNNPMDYKYTIHGLFHAIELLLKDRLETECL